MVEVFDNFFPRDIKLEIFNSLQRPKWSLTGGSNFQRFWHMENLEEEEYFSKFLFQKICNKLPKMRSENPGHTKLLHRKRLQNV